MADSTTASPLPGLNIPLPDFLHYQDGEIRLVGHRISLFNVVREYDFGSQAESIALKFPTLTLGQVFKVLAFYVENQAAVSKYVAEYEQALDEQQAKYPSRITLQMLRERLRARDADRAAELKTSETSA